MPRRGTQGAAIVAKKALSPYGYEVTTDIIKGFYDVLKGQSLTACLRAVERCFHHPIRLNPQEGRRPPAPSPTDIMGELMLEERERKSKLEARSREKCGKELTLKVFRKELAQAKYEHPEMFDGSNRYGIESLAAGIEEKLTREERNAPPGARETQDLFDSPF